MACALSQSMNSPLTYHPPVQMEHSTKSGQNYYSSINNNNINNVHSYSSAAYQSSTLSLAAFASDIEAEITRKVLKKLELNQNNPNNILLVTICKIVDDVVGNINNNLTNVLNILNNKLCCFTNLDKQHKKIDLLCETNRENNKYLQKLSDKILLSQQEQQQLNIINDKKMDIIIKQLNDLKLSDSANKNNDGARAINPSKSDQNIHIIKNNNDKTLNLMISKLNKMEIEIKNLNKINIQYKNELNGMVRGFGINFINTLTNLSQESLDLHSLNSKFDTFIKDYHSSITATTKSQVNEAVIVLENANIKRHLGIMRNCVSNQEDFLSIKKDLVQNFEFFDRISFQCEQLLAKVSAPLQTVPPNAPSTLTSIANAPVILNSNTSTIKNKKKKNKFVRNKNKHKRKNKSKFKKKKCKKYDNMKLINKDDMCDIINQLNNNIKTVNDELQGKECIENIENT